MRIESDGHSRGNPRLFELIEHAPKTGKSPTIWAWPEIIDYLKIAGQPVAGPWPPHQEPRPDPEEDSLPVAIVEPDPATRPTNELRPTDEIQVTPAVAPQAGPATPALGGSEAPDEPPAAESWAAATLQPQPQTDQQSAEQGPAEASGQLRHPESSLRDTPYDNQH